MKNKIDLSNKELTYIPEKYLNDNSIDALILRNNKLTTIPEKLKELTNLKYIDLRGNPIDKLPNIYGLFIDYKIYSKIMFSHYRNQFDKSNIIGINYELYSYKENDPLDEKLKSLTNLQYLDLSNNFLKQIPIDLFGLSQITHLYLQNNKINQIPKEIHLLKNLEYINLGQNKIKELNDNILSLENLRNIKLYNNNFEAIPQQFRCNSKINKIDLSNKAWLKQEKDNQNQIKEIPLEILERKIEELDLKGNPIESPPIEIANQGIEAIRNYFEELEKNKDFLYELKLIIIGEPRAGKSTLAKTLTEPDYIFTDEQSTEGIDIHKWIIPKEEFSDIELTKDFRVNIWDFGGQEIYHSTHQFFLTKRSVYILLTESRKSDRHEDFYYWLNIVKILGDNSPLILVVNKCDEPTIDLPIKDYSEKFRNIIDYKKISCTPEYADTIDALKAELKRIITNKDLLPHIGTTLPKVWIDIRNELEELKLAGENYISFDDYLQICKKHEMSPERAKWLSQYLHDLGVILHFQDDINLFETIILNHDWVTAGVYNVLDSQKVIDANGRFTDKDLIDIWSNERYKTKRKELLALMENQKFEICFKLSQGIYLAPALLPQDKPDYDWNYQNNIHFEYLYKFMPKGILTRFIVKRNKDIYNNIFWKYGVIISNEETIALVKENYFERKITISIRGKNKKEMLGIIRKTIFEINSDFHNLETEEKIPCNCKVCSNSENPNFYSYDTLKNYEQKKVKNIRCEKSLEEVNVYLLINDVIIEFDFEEQNGINVKSKKQEQMNNDSENNLDDNTNNKNLGKSTNTQKNNPWISGSFYLVVFIVVVTTISLVGYFAGVWVLPIIIISALLSISVIGAFQLKNDESIKEENFLKLMIETFKRLPLLRSSNK